MEMVFMLLATLKCLAISIAVYCGETVQDTRGDIATSRLIFQ